MTLNRYEGNLIKTLKDVMLDPEFEGWLKSIEGWNSLLVDHEAPIIHRMWRQIEDHRLYLHVLEPLGEGQEAFYHTHPWPQAVMVLSGSYVMGVGDKADPMHKEACMFYAPEGMVAYQMMEPSSMHWVRPMETCYSIMLSGPPFPQPQWIKDREQQKPKPAFKELDVERRTAMLSKFSELIFEDQ